MTLWCPVLKLVLKTLHNLNIYKGPDNPVNLKPTDFHIESLTSAYINDRSHEPNLKEQASAFLAADDIQCNMVALPPRDCRPDHLLETLAYPGFSTLTIINTAGWNEDMRSRRVEDLSLLGLTEASVQLYEAIYGIFMIEPSAWYEDFAEEITIQAPITWRKLLEAYLLVKSGRNDCWYELLSEATVETSADHVTITLEIDHGS